MTKIFVYSNLEHNPWELYHIRSGNWYPSTIEYNRRIELRIGLHILLRFLRRWKPKFGKSIMSEFCDQKWDLRASFVKNHIEEVRASRCKKQYQYFISHNFDEIIVLRSNIKEIQQLRKFSWRQRFTKRFFMKNILNANNCAWIFRKAL